MKLPVLRDEKGQMNIAVSAIFTLGISLVLVTVMLAISQNVETATGVTNSFIDLGQTLMPAIVPIILVASMIVVVYWGLRATG